MKVCSQCGDPKELSDFSKQKSCRDGYRNACKLCRNEQRRKYYEENKEIASEYSKKYYEFNKDLVSKYHRKYYEENKEYIYGQIKKYRENNKELIIERGKKFREANPSYRKIHYETYKERIAAQVKKWQKVNPDKRRSHCAKRRSIKLQAHPLWAATLEKRQIEGIYTLAKIQSEATGKKYHVDHIHPLQAPKEVMFEGEMIPLICGLHVPANLQILEASVNCSKSNKFEPYIESECDFTELWQVRSNDRTLIPAPIDRIPCRYPRAFIKPRKSKGVPKGQLALF